MTAIQDVKHNWEMYRCRPDVMMMAAIYGHNTTQNLEYCLRAGFEQRASGAIAPFYTFLGSFVGILSTLLGSINSVKMIFATIVGSSTSVFNEFSQRMKAFFYRIQLTTIRMKFLMGRVFATMYAVMFMGLSGMKAALNFSNNASIWGFIDAVCFDPDTLIKVLVNGSYVEKPIHSVQIGDILSKGERVTGTFKFLGDGQEMVRLGDIIVSTNHYVMYKNSWIQSRNHPDAVALEPWNGGVDRPLICLNTDTNTFVLGKELFRDYDETSEGDKESMTKAINMLNGKMIKSSYINSTNACSPNTILRMKDSLVPVKDVCLGMETTYGTILGIIKKTTNRVCEYKGELFAPATIVWSEKDNQYLRVMDLVAPREVADEIFYSFVVSPSATLETSKGVMFRDYIEIHDPDMETSYAEALKSVEN